MGGVLSWFASTPLSVLVNGNVAVQYFFVLTGFLVARSVFLKPQTDRRTVAIKSVNRYFRLLPTVFAATLFTALTMVIHWQKHLDIAGSVMNPDFLTSVNSFTPTAGNLLANLFVLPFLRNSLYVQPFWTIRYEFFGYILCLVGCYFLRGSRWRRMGYGLAAALSMTQLSFYYIPFFLGVFVADLLYTADQPTVLSRWYANWIHRKWFLALLIPVGLYFACIPMYYTPLYAFLQSPYLPMEPICALGVAILLYVSVHLKAVRRVFAAKPLLWLGKLSYPIYAFHFPLMLSLQAWLFGLFLKTAPYDQAAVGAFLLTCLATLILSYASWYWLERNRNYDIRRVLARVHGKA
ncbi:MAG: acyltransferase [Candidatus Limiplasma sp.]|nr:acyltransferase [Candidatus Limiplasma sp.]